VTDLLLSSFSAMVNNRAKTKKAKKKAWAIRVRTPGLEK